MKELELRHEAVIYSRGIVHGILGRGRMKALHEPLSLRLERGPALIVARLVAVVEAQVACLAEPWLGSCASPQL